jgi:hypothetical protein
VQGRVVGDEVPQLGHYTQHRVYIQVPGVHLYSGGCTGVLLGCPFCDPWGLG